MAKSLLFALVALCISASMAGAAPRSSHDEDPLRSIYVRGMAEGTGGTYGYYLKQVGGPVLFAHNETFVYDPAGASKTLMLAYALNQVATGGDSLTGSVDEWVYPSSRNAHGNPASTTLCPDAADEISANAVAPKPALGAALDSMMRGADNRMTRAIELRYGRDNFNAFASSLGMTDTVMNQIHGCGSDNGQHSTWTLADGGKLYEAISDGTAVPAELTDSLYGYMGHSQYDIALSLSVNSFMPSLVTANDLGTTPKAFTDALIKHASDGVYDLCPVSCATNDSIIRDEAGVITVPVQTPTGVVETTYVFGSFIANEHTECADPVCASGSLAYSQMRRGVTEMLRQVIDSALQTWAAVPTLNVAPAQVNEGRVRVEATLKTKYKQKHPTGRTIRFSAGAIPICRAKTNRKGVAACSGKATGATSFTATYAGARDLFAVRATAKLN